MESFPGSATFVIPTMNEQETVQMLAERIDAVCAEISLPHSILFIDDGSTDATWSRIETLATANEHIAGIRFRRNFGKAAALAAGFAHADGDVVFTMDADLQDDPNEIPRFIEKLNEGYDVVSGWKQKRKDALDKTLPSKVFNRLVSFMTGVRLNDHNCGFKAYRQAVTKDVTLYGERHRFVPVLAAARGWRIGEIPVVHHARQFGHSKYGVSRLTKGFLDLLSIFFLTTFGKRPFHFVGAIGLLFFVTGGLGMMYLTAVRVLSWQIESLEDFHLHTSPLFYYCITAVLLGAQLFLAGLLAELIVSLSDQTRHPFSILQVAGSPDRVSAPPPTGRAGSASTTANESLQVTESDS
jgi:dolichol-phosphate mannosyltransferase